MQFDLVFEGGGAKGMVFVGAMEEFHRRGHTHGRLLGTSAGAITASLLAAGYSDSEMLAALAQQQDGHSVFAGFMGQPGPLPPAELVSGSLSQALQELKLPFLPEAVEKRLDLALLGWLAQKPTGQHLLSLVERGGWYAADAFVTWFASRLDTGAFHGQPRAFSQLTLGEFFAATQTDLSLVAADISRGLKLVLNHRTAPAVPLVWAVRMSMSIPLLWQEVTWQASWGAYRGQTLAGDSIVDGGLVSNFPLELFLSDLKPVQEVMGPKTGDNVLGLLIDDDLPVPNAPPAAPANPNSATLDNLATVRRLHNLVNTALGANDKAVTLAFENLVAHMPAAGYGLTEFDMPPERRSALLEAGRASMQAYLDQRAPQPALTFAAPNGPNQLADAANRLAQTFLRHA